MCVCSVQEKRAAIKELSKVKEEPCLFVQLTEKDEISCIFVCADGITVCDTTSVSQSFLLLISLYFLLNLNYPDRYAQLLGLVQVLCLDTDFPVHLLSTDFVQLKESLALKGS